MLSSDRLIEIRNFGRMHNNPEQAEIIDELLRLLDENATLRARVAELEEDVQRIEREPACVSCSDALRRRIAELEGVVKPLNELRQVEGVVIHVFCDKPDFDASQPDAAVEISDWRFGWSNKRFTGDTFAKALQSAVEATREAALKAGGAK